MIEPGIDKTPAREPPIPSPKLGKVATRPGTLSLLVVALSLALLFAPPFLLSPKEDQYWLGLSAKYMALAILALSVDLVWGYTGLLSLGQGLYFGLGAYMVAYALTLQKAARDMNVPVGIAPPQFMQYTGPAPNDPSYVVPPALSLIAPLGDIRLALLMAIVLPSVVAILFGLVTFRLRIRGVYFALVTQALLLAAFILVRNQQRFTGGVVGIKDLAYLELWGRTFNLSPAHLRELNLLLAGVLVVCFLLCAGLVQTKFGRILTAIRDNENRVLALGYNTAMYKTFLFAFAGALAGLAGGLYVAANRVCDSQYLSVGFSIEAVIWVAVGGRGTLLGAVVGALLVGFGQSYISSAFPLYWPVILGALFVLVVLFLPRGLTPVAGPGALLGALIGVTAVNFLEQVLDLSKAQRALVACPVILLGVFLPRAMIFFFRLVIRILQDIWSGRNVVQDVPNKALKEDKTQLAERAAN
jgi:urea transport system permease protein